jgi:hypothetical protein
VAGEWGPGFGTWWFIHPVRGVVLRFRIKCSKESGSQGIVDIVGEEEGETVERRRLLFIRVNKRVG